MPEHLAPTSALRAGRSIPHSKFCYSRAHDSDADARKSRRDQRCCDSPCFFFFLRPSLPRSILHGGKGCHVRNKWLSSG